MLVELFVFLSERGTSNSEFFIVSKAVEENDPPSRIQHRAEFVFDLLLIFSHFLDRREGPDRDHADRFVDYVHPVVEESCAAQASVVHHSFIGNISHVFLLAVDLLGLSLILGFLVAVYDREEVSELRL